MDVLKLATEMEDTVIEYRRWLHQHAELPWKEKETTEFIEEKIKEIIERVVTRISGILMYP